MRVTGTAAGDLLRRYWHPAAVAAELRQEKPTDEGIIMLRRLLKEQTGLATPS